MSNIPRLPPEIWLDIIDWATEDETPNVDYVHFERIPRDARSSELVGTRKALSQVSRGLRNLIMPQLYKEVWVNHGADELRTVLQKPRDPTSERPQCYGDTVRRLVLPYSSTAGKSPLPYLDILRTCLRLEVLVRPQLSLPEIYRLSFDFETNIVQLPSLRRLEWCHHSEADRAGGINSLSAVLRNSPSLRYLFIDRVVELSPTGMDPTPLELKRLKTLRLGVVNGLLLHQITQRWSLPSLTRLVLDRPMPEPQFVLLCQSLGTQLELLEFGGHLRFYTVDYISLALMSCPTLKELNFHIFFTIPPSQEDPNINTPSRPHTSLKTIGMHSAVNGMLSNGQELWDRLREHFTFLAGERLESLERVVLYGEWKFILDHPMFQPIKQKLQDRGLELELYEGR
ncbi:hypothetical protein CC1G_00551 [Coprinopsis cinerea okayama7|uniref:F-box domain-containing protein n=1 Tax=Coprinopsis cinerea (strain Okayama-7 / 130 / ATCC MYA-4618 / FGSC 9003) TaxID=240176 RepID=A8N3C7_COPC7|nr:hypothetical protein CC1G_00551 [Coprinopsis cinerea okayama7\|eukprot:XP_001829372.1 hypothetical protein CC1G_00551 [Coprinopsis cinerea okayama7\